MSLLSDSDQQSLREMFAGMTTPVTLVFFTQSLGCETCGPTRQILDEVVSLGERLTLVEHNLILDKEKVQEYGVDRAPAIALVTDHDTGIRFYGAPAGYEFMALVEAILIASSGDSGLSDESRALVAAVDKPMRIQVFVTPT